MRRSLSASLLVLALCVSALAGDISNPPVAPPLTNTVQEQTDEGWTDPAAPSSTDSVQADSADGLTAAALTIFNSVLALF